MDLLLSSYHSVMHIDYKINKNATTLASCSFNKHGLITGRMPQSGKAGIKFTHGAKNQVFRPIHVKLGRADRHLGPLGCAEFSLNRHRGWELGMRPAKNQKFPLFGKELPLRGDSLDQFRNFWGGL